MVGTSVRFHVAALEHDATGNSSQMTERSSFDLPYDDEDGGIRLRSESRPLWPTPRLRYRGGGPGHFQDLQPTDARRRVTMSMMVMDTIAGFEWDDGNMGKVEARGFAVADIERAFLNGRGTYFPDRRHSEAEERYWLIGITDDGRHVTVPFTVRTQRIRPITAWTTARKYRKWVR